MSRRVPSTYSRILGSIKDGWSSPGNNVYPHIRMSVLPTQQLSGLVCYFRVIAPVPSPCELRVISVAIIFFLYASHHRTTQKEKGHSLYTTREFQAHFSFCIVRENGMPGMEIPKGQETQEENTQSFPRRHCKVVCSQTNWGHLLWSQDTNKYILKLRAFIVPGEEGRRHFFLPFPHTIYLLKLLSIFPSLQNLFLDTIGLLSH